MFKGFDGDKDFFKACIVKRFKITVVQDTKAFKEQFAMYDE